MFLYVYCFFQVPFSFSVYNTIFSCKQLIAPIIHSGGDKILLGGIAPHTTVLPLQILTWNQVDTVSGLLNLLLDHVLL